MNAMTNFVSHYRRAIFWATSHGADAALADQFAESYATLLEDTPANRYPDLPDPTPAEFADINVLEYGQLVDTTPIGTVVPIGSLWVARCTTCQWNPTREDATTYEAAERAAALHNSDIHSPARRPQWSDVAAWAAAERTGAHA